jgi:peptidoglycan/xylan/chitin deacetylase (PgdA/CDA1 family)
MHLLVVNYHYIEEREDEYRYPGIFPVSVERFRQQLELLGRFFSFISQEELISAVEGKNKLPANSCLITFDDGLMCQYKKALPVLEEKKIPAIFFASGLPYDTGCKVLIVHKIHWCLAHLDPTVFLGKISDNYKKVFNKDLDLKKIDVSDEKVAKQYNYGDIEAKRLKFILNYVFDEQTKEALVTPIFVELVGDEKNFFDSFYLGVKELEYLASKFYLGVHGYTHQSFAYLNFNQINKEIIDCREVFRKLSVQENLVPSFSFPRGGLPVGNLSELYSLLKKNGFKIGFTTERSFNCSLKEPFLFARLDANDILGGKSPLFEITGNAINITNPKLTMSRQKFIQEAV